MNPAFDRCVPVLMKDGSEKECSLQDLLISAHKISALNLPMTTEHALINILGAATAHMLKIEDDNKLKVAFKQYHKKGLPADRIREYFKKYECRFELFKRPKKGFPFLQPCDPSFLEVKDALWNIGSIIDFYPRGHNPIMQFSVDPEMKGLTPQQAFFFLLSFQFFGPAAGRPCQKNKAFAGLPNRSAPIWVCNGGNFIPKGTTLCETVLFNIDLWQEHRRSKDCPSWALDIAPVPNKDAPVNFGGPLHRASFPHHWLLLEPPCSDGLVKRFVHPSSYSLASFEPLETNAVITAAEQTTKRRRRSTEPDKVERPYRPTLDSWTKRQVLIHQSVNDKRVFTPPVRLTRSRILIKEVGDERALLGVDLLFTKTDDQGAGVRYRIEQRIDVPAAVSQDMAQTISAMTTDAQAASRCFYAATQSFYHSRESKTFVQSRESKTFVQMGRRLMAALGTLFEREYIEMCDPAAVKTAEKRDKILERWREMIRRQCLDMYDELAPQRFSDHFEKGKRILCGKLVEAGLGYKAENKETESDE